ncbi:uncharacterized protein si:ch1073-126c3.2 [Pimephales promelas]|uniref:uncharacterized protein si:ch1073-126c3.2 n=1 Tax=Pimephales promelas TaxID=90988 RepID=UPI001955AD74|nr:uncharacterized protein si:ch1073-126c3.2 [Pimephales promelas]KAG1950889.1 hypothetical protein F2P79_011181 [Pimephales promelas]
MKSTTISRTWKMLFLLFAFLLTRAHGQNTSCSSSEFSFEMFSKKLQDMKNCLETVSDTWTTYQRANLFNQLQTLTDIIQKKQNKEFLPANCTAPTVPKDGGLLCVSVRDKTKTYCKPMCNTGYDFDFLRRSRLFEECSATTQHKWTTQYIGGNRLAICNKSKIKVSGAPSAYFPEDHDCNKIKSHEQLLGNITNIFQSELKKAGIPEGILKEFSLLCG